MTVVPAAHPPVPPPPGTRAARPSENSRGLRRLAWASSGVLALLFVALVAPGAAWADITNGGAHVQQIFNSWARPIAACMIVAGAIRAIARRNLVGIVTFLALVLALGGFVISPDRGLNVSNSLLGKILD